MRKNLVLKSTAAIAVALALILGITAATVPAEAASCPSTYCGSTAGWTYDGRCVRDLGHCVEECVVFRSSYGARCKTSCGWW